LKCELGSLSPSEHRGYIRSVTLHHWNATLLS
jgi:hypothetical protein